VIASRKTPRMATLPCRWTPRVPPVVSLLLRVDFRCLRPLRLLRERRGRRNGNQHRGTEEQRNTKMEFRRKCPILLWGSLSKVRVAAASKRDSHVTPLLARADLRTRSRIDSSRRASNAASPSTGVMLRSASQITFVTGFIGGESAARLDDLPRAPRRHDRRAFWPHRRARRRPGPHAPATVGAASIGRRAVAIACARSNARVENWGDRLAAGLR
jgi:hypothetical protein